MNNKITILDIANYILFHFQNKSNSISHKKLQKLLYYVKVWSYIADQPLIDEPFYLWEQGPINKTIYSQYGLFDSVPIPKPNKSFQFSQEIETLINFIVENYVEFDAMILSQLIHTEIKNLNTEKNQLISYTSIKLFYSDLPFAKNFPLDKNKPFYPIITPMDYAFILDFDDSYFDFSNGHFRFKNYSEYKKQKIKINKQLQAIFG